MQVFMNTGGVAMTNAFVVADENAKQAVLFDAPDHTVAPLLDAVEQRGWDLIGLWLTHGHFDHLADHAVVTQRFPNASLLIHPLEEPHLQKPGGMWWALPFTVPGRSADGYVNDGDRLKLGTLDVEVILTPGHAPGHVMYHIAGERLLVGGDLIIGGAVGRTDLPGADAAQLESSIRRVMQLPDETRLLPGHGAPRTLGEERQSNPYVQMALRGELAQAL